MSYSSLNKEKIYVYFYKSKCVCIYLRAWKNIALLQPSHVFAGIFTCLIWLHQISKSDSCVRFGIMPFFVNLYGMFVKTADNSVLLASISDRH